MAAGGSDDAFATLYRRHHQPVYRYCLTLVRQEADARDALQSTMLAALSSLRARPIEGAFKPWLFRIAHNQSISIIRARGREAPAEAPPATAVVNDDPETREQLRTLMSDLAALPDRQRGAIVMRELSGLSYTAIAAAMGTSEAGGKQLVYEARSALHELRDGHEMGCEVVRERISARDRRLLRGRKVRAHLRGCQPCRDFEQGVRRRRTALAALVPPLAPLAATGVLQEVLGGGGAGGGAGGSGAAVGGTGLASGGTPLAGSAIAKLAAAVLLTGAAGVGAYAAGNALLGGSQATPAAAAAGAPDMKSAAGDPRGGASDGARTASGREDRGGSGNEAAGGAAPNARSSSGDAEKGAGSDATSDSGGPGATGHGGNPGEPAGPGPANGGPGGSGGSGGGTGEPPPGPPPPPDPTPPPGGGGSGAPPGAPPGHGGTPPGQGGTPPGQAGGGVPPGHINNPGGGGGRP